MSKIEAPFTPEQVEGLNRWQQAGYVHEFTCANPHVRYAQRILEARPGGWYCPGCGTIVQLWAHDFMAAGPPPNPLDGLLES